MERTSTPPSVGIIILNYNGWKDTLECLDSVLRLDYPNFRVILVDNRSTDDSPERLSQKINEARPRGPRDIELIESGVNAGYGAGNNLGIARALELNLDFVWILNNDTIVDTGALTELIRSAQAGPDIGMMGAALFFFYSPQRLQALGGGFINKWIGTSRHFMQGHAFDPESAVALPDLDYINGASILARCAMIKEIGLFDEKFFLYWEDADLSFRARAAGWKITCAPKAKVLHKVSRTIGAASPITDYHHARSSALFFNKNRKRFWRFTGPLYILLKLINRLMRLRLDAVWQILKASGIVKREK